jgi:hypothetical protein
MESVETLKAKLDKDLEFVDLNVGILFGEELFAEFKNRGWLTFETFGIFGTSSFAEKLPAYAKTHYSLPSWSIGSWEHKVGSVDKRDLTIRSSVRRRRESLACLLAPFVRRRVSIDT